MAQFDFAAVKNEVIANVGTLVTETAKNELLGWFQHTALPYAEEVADAYVKALNEQSATEAGWRKVRDGIVLPTLIAVAEFAVEKTLTVLEASVKEAEKPEEAPVETVTIA